MASMNVPVINVNGLNKVDSAAGAGKLVDWKHLDNWIKEQENYFNRNKICSDREKINHMVLNIDVNQSNTFDEWTGSNRWFLLVFFLNSKSSNTG